MLPGSRRTRFPSAVRALKLAGLGLAWIASVGCRQTVVLEEPGLADSGTEAGNGGGGGFNGGDGGGRRDDGGGVCPGGQIVQLKVNQRMPDVLLLLDRSAAMQTHFGNNNTRLDAAQQEIALLVTQYQFVVRFGYAEFPSAAGTCSGSTGCCAGDIALPITLGYQAVKAAMHPCATAADRCASDQRPVAQALASARDMYRNQPQDDAMLRSYYVLLLAGGDPSCADPSAASPCNAAAAEATYLNNAGVRTIVVSVGDDTTTSPGGSCLERLALAGGWMRGPPFHYVTHPGDFHDVLNTIGRGLAVEACHIDLDSTPADPDWVIVRVGGQPIQRDGNNGWDFDGSQTLAITLHGLACEQLLHGDGHQVQVSSVSGCGPVHH